MKSIKSIFCGIILCTAPLMIYGAETVTFYDAQTEAALEILAIIAQHNNYYAMFLQQISLVQSPYTSQEIMLMAYLAYMQLFIAGKPISDELQALYDILLWGNQCP